MFEKELEEQVHFKVSPPESEATRDLKVKLTLSITNDEVGKLVQTYLHTIKVKQRELVKPKTFEGVKQSQGKNITVTMGPIDEFGVFNLTFSDSIYLPDDVLTWNNKNQNFIVLKYIADEGTKERLAFDKLTQNYEWKVTGCTSRSISIRMIFGYPEYVTGSDDRINVNFMRKFAETFIGGKLSVKGHADGIDHKIEKKISFKVKDVKKDKGKGEFNLSDAMPGASVTLANFITSILQSKVIQYLWGIINSL